MKKLLLTLFFVAPLIATAQHDSKINYGDPFIMLYDGAYYAYGTSSDQGIEVFISDDLHKWEKPDGHKFALHKDDVWGDKWFWAPEVYHVNGKFYMYYSAEERICVAVADSPLGPFKQEIKEPMIDGEKCIDNSLFIDDDGKAYLFFDRFNDGLNIWVADLNDDLITLKPETMTKCIAVSQPWEESLGRVNEGPFVMKYKGKYYMTYSANDYRSPDYGIGLAIASDIHGEWVKYDANPLYQNIGGLVGIGHSAMFRDKKGKLKITFHAHKDKETVHPRSMYISSVKFKKINGEYIPVVSPDYITPTLE